MEQKVWNHGLASSLLSVGSDQSNRGHSWGKAGPRLPPSTQCGPCERTVNRCLAGTKHLCVTTHNHTPLWARSDKAGHNTLKYYAPLFLASYLYT